MLCALAVFAVVQLIQDMYLTPRIMGHVMGLNPAIILLSLSIWGSLMGIIGLIIALPLTTLLLSYYRRFILKEVVAEAETEQKTEEDAQKSEENEFSLFTFHFSLFIVPLHPQLQKCIGN